MTLTGGSLKPPSAGSMHYEKTPRFKRSKLDGSLRHRLERTSFRAGGGAGADV
jgi:hypothetical protein